MSNRVARQVVKVTINGCQISFLNNLIRCPTPRIYKPIIRRRPLPLSWPRKVTSTPRRLLQAGKSATFKPQRRHAGERPQFDNMITSGSKRSAWCKMSAGSKRQRLLTTCNSRTTSRNNGGRQCLNASTRADHTINTWSATTRKNCPLLTSCMRATSPRHGLTTCAARPPQ